MVLAAKVFLVKETIDLDTVTAKLKDFRSEQEIEQEGQNIQLLTEIKDLTIEKDSIRGIFYYDETLSIFHHGKTTYTPKTIAAPFIFDKLSETLLLTVMEKKQRANSIANQLSRILFIGTGQIVEARIKPEVLKSFHETNFDDTKVVFFDDVDVPNVSKLSLYGSTLGNTSLYTNYLTHGKIWYVVMHSRKYGYIVGVTRNAVITVFSRIDEPEFSTYITGEIFPLIMQSYSS